jgi:hypothetical protein
MSNRKCRKADGLKYVTKRLEANPGLLKTISDCPSKYDRTRKLSKREMQILMISNILKSHKH